MAGLLVAVVFCLTAIPGAWGRWALFIPYAWSLAGSRRGRPHGCVLAGVASGLLIASAHVADFGAAPAVRREFRRAAEVLAALHAKAQELAHRRGATGAPLSEQDIDSLVATVPGSGVYIDDRVSAVWGGDAAEPLRGRGTWAIARRQGSFLAVTSVEDSLSATVRVPLALDARQDTSVSLDAGSVPVGLFGPRLPTSLTGWAYAILAGILVMEVLRCRARGRALLGLAIIGAGRAGLAVASPQGALFGSGVFATSIPLLGSPGDIAATTASFLLAASLLRRRGTARSLPGAVTIIVGAVGAASVMAGLWQMAAPFCAIHVERLEVITTTPSVWAVVAAAAFMFVALALVAASASLPACAALACAGVVFARGAGADWLSLAPFFFLAVLLLRLPRLWAVTQATAVVIVACAAILPRGERLMAMTHRQDVERLAARLASEQRQWFRFLARGVASSWRESESLHTIWLQSPLRRLSATGQLMELVEGIPVDRLSFGIRHEPSVPAEADTGLVVWEETTEEIPPPRSVVNAAIRRGRRTVVVSLVQDLLTLPSEGEIDYLADGTPWPGNVRCADRGLLSLQDPDGPGMGWRRSGAGGGHVFRFQREYADGPHVVDLAVLPPTTAIRVASWVALAGLLCLLAHVVLAVDRIWSVPSWHAMFYRYRDRLLPLLLLVGTGPLVALVVVGARLERAARDRDTWMETGAKARDVAGSFRVELLRQASELAPYISGAHGTSRRGGSGPRFAIFDSTGAPRTPRDVDETLPAGLVRVVAERGRNLLWVDGNPPLVHALVPHPEGALLLVTPIDAALAAALGGTHDWTAAVWRHGRRATAVLSPRSRPVPSLLPRAAGRALASSAQVSVQAGRWAFAFIPDDLVGESLVVGVRMERPGRAGAGSAGRALWALAILLPVVTLTVLVSSLAARLVTIPISRLTALAGRVGSGAPHPRWPRLSGELGELSHALDEMTSRLAASVSAVAREKARLETILEQLDAGVIVADRSLEVERVNGAARRMASLTGDIKGSLAQGPLEGIARRALETRAAARETRQSDERRLWQVGAAPLTGHDGALHGVVIVLEETTEIAERQRLLAWADFAREAAHEIKNPLTPIKLSAQHLKRAFDDRAPDFAEILAHATEMIERQTARMEAILRDLSSFSKATGRPFAPVAIVPLVAQIVRDYGYYASRGVIVRLSEGDRHLRVTGDAEALRTICANIIDNAVKAVEHDGEVVVSVMGTSDAVIFRCDDTGPGIPEDLVEKVFEPGFSQRPGGTGLGLAICRSLVTAHGGSIHITDLAPGTRVDVRFPAVAPTPRD